MLDAGYRLDCIVQVGVASIVYRSQEQFHWVIFIPEANALSEKITS